jgi:2'-5' RNA ligase
MSVILALFPPPRQTARLQGVTRRLAVPPSYSYHLTLVDVGDVEDVPLSREAFTSGLLGVARRVDAAIFQLGHVTVMPHVRDGQRAVASVVRPAFGLRLLQAALAAWCVARGCVLRWPVWRPHLTLGYQPASAPAPQLRVPPLLCHCIWLTLCWEHTSILLPLGG